MMQIESGQPEAGLAAREPRAFLARDARIASIDAAWPDAAKINAAVGDAEGWALWESDGDTRDEDVFTALRAEKCDDHDAFQDDGQVWRHIVTQAVAGSALHVATLRRLAEHGPIELARILDVITAHERIALVRAGLDVPEDLPPPNTLG